MAPTDAARVLSHVRWLGGGSGGGKSSVARALGERFGVRVHATDDAMADHARRLDAGQAPLLHAFGAMSLDERWVTRSPAEMLATFHWFAGEGFDLIVEDLLELPRDRTVVVEGFRLLPALVRPLLTRPEQALWLLPTREFRARVFAGRDDHFTAATSDPPRAMTNLLVRDAWFTERLATEVGDDGWVVDGGATLDDLVTRAARRFALTGVG